MTHRSGSRAPQAKGQVSARDRRADDVAQASVEAWHALSRTWDIWWTRHAGAGAVMARAAERTARLLAHARRHSPFYRDAWRGIGSAPALTALPPVTKHELMARFDEWVTDRRIDRQSVEAFITDRSHIGERYLDRYVIWKSSGTTGEPAVFVQDADALAVYDALIGVQLQAPALAGRYALGILTHGGRAALVAATGDHFASIASWQRMCRGSPWPTARAFSVMDPLPTLVAALNDYQPAFLASYPTTLAMLAAEQRAGRLRIAPECIWSGGECLARSTALSIEEAFASVLLNEYGASECMSIACSCSSGWLHVNADWVVLEPVDRDYRPTRAGESSHSVLLTNLANLVQPVIRYDLGDSIVVNPDACACGSPLPAIRAEGRRDDVLLLRAGDGAVVPLSPLALTTVVEDATAGHRFQLVQTAPDRIAVRLAIQDAGERSVEWDATERALHAYLAHQSLDNVELCLDPLAPVPDPRSGKLREVIAAGAH
jgi:phenylacetate-CoA ligase